MSRVAWIIKLNLANESSIKIFVNVAHVSMDKTSIWSNIS